jgi:F0F1-type ATP synthase epsilon subunit
MIKKIAILALAVSAAFSNAFAADPECSVVLGTSSCTFRGTQWTPEVKRVRCGTDDFTEFKSVKYGQNINAGADAGTVTIELKDGTVINHKFEILQKEVGLKILDYEKELGAENPEFEYEIDDEDNLSSLDADTLANFKKTLKSTLKMVVADGVEKVGDVFDITLDESLELDKLFPNYMIQVEPGTLTITKTKITVTAKDASKAYGEADPKTFEYTITGNIKASDYDKLGKITLTRADGEDAGEYEIAVSVDQPADDHGYVVSTVPAKFTITPIAVSLTIDDMTKGYGNATKEFTYKATGLVGQDELKDVTLVCAKCASDNLENVGEYEITASIKEGSNPNYTITTTPGKLTVTPKAVTVTVKDAEKVYGEKDPTFTFETEGLVGDNEKLEKATIARADGEDVGTYKVSVDFETGSNPNYTVTVKEGTLTVTPKDVTLTADNVSKKFGETDPELTYTVDGLVKLGETEDKLAGVKLTREKGENAGTYAITATVDAKANPNYIVTVAEGGTLTIIANNDKIVVTIKGHTSTGVYNGKEQTVKGFDITTESKAYDLKFVEFSGDSIVSGTNAGTYAMGLSKDNFKNTSLNYPNVEFEVTDGSLEISPKTLVVTAVADSIIYGDNLPTEFKWTVDSLLKGDELDNIHVSVGDTGLLDVGEYKLDFDKKEPTNTNYVVSEFVPAVFKVLKREVTVTIRDTSKVYGSADPVLDSLMTVSGLRDGDVLEGVTLVREKGENVLLDSAGKDSSYKIAATFDEEKLNPNYQVKVKQGHFKITPYQKRITVFIFGEEVTKAATGDTITVPKSFDLMLCGELCGDTLTLDSAYAYSVDFVKYIEKKWDADLKDSVIVENPTVSGVRPYIYPFNLQNGTFVNISPNFSNVVFRFNGDGTLIIKKPEDLTKIAAVKGVAKFGLSSAGRRIQVSGSTVGSRFEVRDMQGKVVRTGAVSSANFEIPVANAGVYAVRVGSMVQKVRVK